MGLLPASESRKLMCVTPISRAKNCRLLARSLLVLRYHIATPFIASAVLRAVGQKLLSMPHAFIGTEGMLSTVFVQLS